MKGTKQHRLMLVGDSMIEYGNWQAWFPHWMVENLGWSGESVGELRRRAELIVRQQQEPDLVLVMIGTNNVAMQDFNFFADYGKILTIFQEGYPGAELVANSLLPMDLRYLAADTLPRVNAQLKDLSPRYGAHYLDVHTHMVDSVGHPLADVLEDEVHLSHFGYTIWAGVLKDFLNSFPPKT
ncbi:MAG: GDSL family lipase [Proteobacteria bacterium]|nr:GDSL family lipase [Pseudomonadota bacterium]MBU1688141.1 GDSL family lipase [Pseudomonadota bacterium]